MAKRPVSLRLDDTVRDRVRREAARRKWTPSFLMAQAIEEWVADDERSSRAVPTGAPATTAPAVPLVDDRPLVTLTVVEKRHQLHVWTVDWAGGSHTAEALTRKAAERLARAWLDQQLGDSAYRLEVAT